MKYEKIRNMTFYFKKNKKQNTMLHTEMCFNGLHHLHGHRSVNHVDGDAPHPEPSRSANPVQVGLEVHSVLLSGKVKVDDQTNSLNVNTCDMDRLEIYYLTLIDRIMCGKCIPSHN